MPKNITLAVDEDVLARYRVLAAEQRTTVNALIRKHMAEATEFGEKRRETRQRVHDMMQANLASDADRCAARSRGEAVHEETWRWSREETYSGPRFDGMQGK